MEFNYKLLDCQTLLTYYNEDVIKINCSNCENHGKNWSCPPHTFDEKTYLSHYEFHYLIVLKIDDSQTIEKDYHTYRKIIGNKLLTIENKFLNAEILYAGHCYHCETCTRNENSKCKYPTLMRYSYESLGIALLKLVADEFYLKKNEGLKIVLGIMFNEKKQAATIEDELKELSHELLSLQR